MSPKAKMLDALISIAILTAGFAVLVWDRPMPEQCVTRAAVLGGGEVCQ